MKSGDVGFGLVAVHDDLIDVGDDGYCLAAATRR